MERSTEILKQKSLVIILAYAPAGLGHLRVTDTLYQGLPEGVTPLLLGSQDKTITTWHRLMSIHPLGRNIMEWMQQGWPEDLFTTIYRNHLRSHSETLYRQLLTILEQRIDLPRTVLVVSTHFGLAHQLAAVKERITKEIGVTVFLVVVVTDDSPQHIWYTPEADLTFVPSERTKDELVVYGKYWRLPPVKIETVAYPVSPLLTKPLTGKQLAIRQTQLRITDDSPIHVAVPISGAAVGLTYNKTLVDSLHMVSPRFHFHIVSKVVPYTHRFLTDMIKRDFVDVSASIHAREIVDKYIELYQKEVISLEVTKPSEHAFKALITPRQVGGSLLLFSQSVGRQELDNLDFLRRHNLLPLVSERRYLLEKAISNETLSATIEGQRILVEASNWRGMELPQDAQTTAQFIWWSLSQGVFLKMLTAKVIPKLTDPHAHELASDGVDKIWQLIADHLRDRVVSS